MGKTRAFVIHPVFSSQRLQEGRDSEQKFAEICGLARAIDLQIVYSTILGMSEIRPATMLSAQAVEDLAGLIEEHEADLLVLNITVSPTQHRNLEEKLHCKVLDRTTLILEIFGARAKSREARWQVALAAEQWQRSRLVKSWTHLERQRGGAGFMGGPGERQLEIDRRLLDDKLNGLRKKIADVKKMRQLQRRTRRYAGNPIIALTGYTNSGKSTLFEQFAGLENLSQNMLFATLETKTRHIRLPSGQHVILSDTVGFVSELPHMLIDAFRSTLEEVQEADLLLHVRDVTASDFSEQKQDVMEVLQHIFSDTPLPPMLEIWNKADLLPQDEYHYLAGLAEEKQAFLMNAHDAQQCQQLGIKIDQMLDRQGQKYDLLLQADELAIKSWLYQHGHVQQETWRDDGLLEVSVTLSKQNYGRLQKKLM